MASLLVGLAALGLTLTFDSRLSASKIVGVGVSVFIAGVTFIAQFLIDVDQRVAQAQQLIRDEFKKVSAATELFALAEESALSTEMISELIKNAASISADGPPLIFQFAQAELARLSGYLRELGQRGNLTYDGEDRDWLLGLTRVAQHTIDATSLSTVDAGGVGFIDGGLWMSDLGAHYLEAQREAIRRGVVIRRIFVVDRPELEHDPNFTGILQQHHEVGVKVRILTPSAITARERTSLFDFIVVDDVLSYELKSASQAGRENPPIMVSTTLYTDGRVQDRIERYRNLWEAGQDFAPAADRARINGWLVRWRRSSRRSSGAGSAS